MRVKKKILVWMLLLIPIVVSTVAVSIGSADYLPTVYMDPPEMILVCGTEFTIDICVDYVVRLWAYQFTLYFDPEVLAGVSVENGPFLEAEGGSVLVVEGPGFNNTKGELGLFAASLFPVENFPSGGSDEYGPLATVTFKVVGTGCSDITLGPEAGLADEYGEFITHKEENPGYFFDSYICSLRTQFWIREKHGTHGGGAFPDWHVGLVGEEQILYSKIASSGEDGAWVQVKFRVESVVGQETEEYWSNEIEIPGVYIDPETGEKVFPLVTVETEPFELDAEDTYLVSAFLYFKSSWMAEYIPYELAEEYIGGAGTGRDIATKFKVVEK